MNRSFRAKLSRLGQFVLGVSIVVPIGVFVFVAVLLADPVISILLPVIGTLAVGLIAWVVFGMRYQARDNGLVSFHGPFRVRCPWEAINRVRKGTRGDLVRRVGGSWFFSPLSSENLIILERSGGKSEVMVSPNDLPGFIEVLKSRAPEATWDGFPP